MVRVPGFNEKTGLWFEKAMLDLKEADQAGGQRPMCWTLRNNPGGLVSTKAVRVCATTTCWTSGEIVSSAAGGETKYPRYSAKQGDITERQAGVVVLNQCRLGKAPSENVFRRPARTTSEATIVRQDQLRPMGSDADQPPAGPGLGAAAT
jgi:hypothetical protein